MKKLGTPYHPMNDSVFAKQNDLPWSADEPLSVILHIIFRIIQSQLLDCATNGVSFAFQGCTDVLMTINALFDRDGPCFKKRTLKVIEKVLWVFNSYAEANKVFGKPTSRASCRINRCMPNQALSSLSYNPRWV